MLTLSGTATGCSTASRQRIGRRSPCRAPKAGGHRGRRNGQTRSRSAREEGRMLPPRIHLHGCERAVSKVHPMGSEEPLNSGTIENFIRAMYVIDKAPIIDPVLSNRGPLLRGSLGNLVFMLEQSAIYSHSSWPLIPPSCSYLVHLHLHWSKGAGRTLPLSCRS